MPVSTRSQITTNPYEIDPKQDMGLSHRNPHHGLKEKMKALTLLYEQQKKEAQTKNRNSLRFSTHPSVDLVSSMKRDNTNVTRTYLLPKPQSEAESKENVDRIVAFRCPRKSEVARKLSLVPQSEPRGIGKTRNEQENEKVLEKNGVIGRTRNEQENERILEKNGVIGIGSRIMVYVRLRPMAKKEREGGERCCVRIVNRRDVYLTEFATENDYLRLKRLRGRHFTFDASFTDASTQQEIYSTTTAELVESVLQGRNGSVFCYGATGAGKTYTMLGTMENPGVMVLAIKDLFNKIRQRSCDGNHVVQLSYLEVYNETVRDLISPGRPLVLREDKQGIVAAGLTQYRAYTTDEVMTLLQQGNRNRTTEPTRCNETSSRSHAILQVAIEYRAKDAFDNIFSRVGKLSLIDLAGSERALATEQRTLRSLEGANINRSLLALSSCINALVEGKKHIPYRNSKLTQLLKDSLGGACNTVMIANISPSNLSFGETQNTLHWADRAKEIRTKACDVNEDVRQIPDSETDQSKLLLELQKENRELRVQLARQQQKLLTVQAQSLATNTSPAPSSLSSLLSPPSSAQPNGKRKTRSSFLSGTCFTPESKKRGDEMVKDLKQTVKDLEAEMQKMRKEHLLLIKQKDEIIRDLSNKAEKQAEGANKKVAVTRASLRPKTKTEGDLKSPSHRFLSPVPTTKKRSFWDITAANSPSVASVNGRKTRSHVSNEPAPAPSKLLQLAYPCFWSVFMFGPHLVNKIMQPGFAHQRV